MRKRKASTIPETPEHREARLAGQRVRQSEWRAVQREKRLEDERAWEEKNAGKPRHERVETYAERRWGTVEERIARNRLRWRLHVEDENDLSLTDMQRLGRRYAGRKVAAGAEETNVLWPKKLEGLEFEFEPEWVGLDEKGEIIWVMESDGGGGERQSAVHWPLMCHDELRAVGAGKSYGPVSKVDTPLSLCPALITEGRDVGKPCHSPAGTRTWHEGVGNCARHRGNSGRSRAEGAWMMAHGFAKELNVSPWEALLMAVRIAAGKVMFSQEMIASAVHNLELEGRVVRGETAGNGIPILLDPDTGEPLGVGKFRDLSFWVTQVDRWHERLMRCSKLAIDSGVAEQLVRNQTLEVQLMARAIEAGIQAAELTSSQELAVRNAMRKELLAIENEKNAMVNMGENAIVGSWDESPDRSPVDE